MLSVSQIARYSDDQYLLNQWVDHHDFLLPDRHTKKKEFGIPNLDVYIQDAQACLNILEIAFIYFLFINLLIARDKLRLSNEFSSVKNRLEWKWGTFTPICQGSFQLLPFFVLPVNEIAKSLISNISRSNL